MRELLLQLETEARRAARAARAARLGTTPGATEHQLALLRTFVGTGHLPSDLEALYRWHDGGDGETWFGGGGFWYFRPIESAIDIVTEWRRQRLDLVSGTTDESTHPPASGIWPTEWVPFLDWNSDVFAVADCRSPDRTPVLGVDLEAGQVVRWASDLQDFFRYVVSLHKERRELDVDQLMAGKTPPQET